MKKQTHASMLGAATIGVREMTLQKYSQILHVLDIEPREVNDPRLI